MVVNSYEDKIQYLVDKVKEVIDISDYEEEKLTLAFKMSMLELPTTRILVTNRISEVINSKSDLYYLTTKITEYYNNLNIDYSARYYKEFTILTRQGRPSKTAIESEIFTLHKDIKEMKDNLDKVELARDIVANLSDIIDKILENLERRSYALIG